MIHWTLDPNDRPFPRVLAAVDAEPRPRARRAWLSLLISIPLLLTLAMTLGAQQSDAAAALADSASAPRTRIRSWTSDRREFAVGDIITVLIDESTVASANKATNNTDSKRRAMNAGAELPGAAGAVGSKSVGLSSSNDGTTRQQGDATRSTKFSGQMSVRVISVTKEGNLQIKGTKLVDIDKNRQEMTLSGIIRPLDVSPRDLVDAGRIADLKLVYAAKGSLGNAKTGILTRILGVFWP